MCLDRKSQKSFNATKDITVWKLCYKVNNRYTALYRYFYYNTNNLMHAAFFDDKLYPDIGFHSFKHKKDAVIWKLKTSFKNDRLADEKNIHLCEFIIPKGSKYYTGYFEEMKCLMSNSLKWIRDHGEITSQKLIH